MSDYDYLFKFIIVGDSYVGKSNILTQYVEKRFRGQHEVTIGVEFLSKIINLHDKDIKIQIWDTAGQEAFKSITRIYYKNSACALLVYDISNRESFLNVKTWLEDCRELTPKDTVILLVGNKCDLTDKRQVSKEEAALLAEQENLLFYECSAKTTYNLNEMFLHAANVVYSRLENSVLSNEEEVNGVKRGIKKIELVSEKQNDRLKKKGCCKNL